MCGSGSTSLCDDNDGGDDAATAVAAARYFSSWQSEGEVQAKEAEVV